MIDPVSKSMAVAGNPFGDPDVARRYEDWYAGKGKRADQLEKQLLQKLLAEFSDAQHVLEIGCGTGHFCRWFKDLGYAVVGLDSSPAMLDVARRLDGSTYNEGDALHLPYAERTFDVAALITTLEFVSDPVGTLREAMRVSRHGLLLGVLNRHSLLAWRYLRSGKPLWRGAKFFSVGELKHAIIVASGDRLKRIRWSTTLWSLPFIADLHLPWGDFIGAAVHMTD